jgi:predicted ArsR family transcriptional regulator
LHRKILEGYVGAFEMVREGQQDFESRYLSRVSHLASDIKSGRQEDKRANVLRQITEEAFAEARNLSQNG